MAKIAAVALLVGPLLFGAPALASPLPRVPIPTLFNTGVDASGHPLPDGTVGDPHYTLSAVPFPSVSSTVVLQQQNGVDAYPIGPWAGNDNLSAWISPDSSNYRTTSVLGEYYYTTTFDLTGFDPSTAQIYGSWSADDVGASMFLNGIQMDILTSLSLGLQNYSGMTTFNYYHRTAQGTVAMDANTPLQAGFVAGLNTLTFRVDNEGGPTGLRVELNASAVPTPEPGSLGILAAGLLAFLGRWRAAPGRHPATPL